MLCWVIKLLYKCGCDIHLQTLKSYTFSGINIIIYLIQNSSHQIFLLHFQIAAFTTLICIDSNGLYFSAENIWDFYPDPNSNLPSVVDISEYIYFNTCIPQIYDFEISINGNIKRCGRSWTVPHTFKPIHFDFNSTYLVIINAEYIDIRFSSYIVPACSYSDIFFLKTFNTVKSGTLLKTYSVEKTSDGYLVGVPSQDKNRCAGFDYTDPPTMHISFGPDIINIAMIKTHLIDERNDSLVLNLIKDVPINKTIQPFSQWVLILTLLVMIV